MRTTRTPGNLSVSSFGYAVSADGRRFLINSAPEETASTPITVVLNWQAGIKR